MLNYVGGYKRSLMHLYPDIGLNRDQFLKYVCNEGGGESEILIYLLQEAGYWQDMNNRRRFFVEFAGRNGFDPLVAEHWYAYTKCDILATKVISLCYH